MIDDKIKFINKLLQDDKELNKYITKIDSKNIKVPPDLNEKIYTSINKKEKNVEVNNNKMFGILRIVACTAFAIIVWKFAVNRNVNDNLLGSRDNLYNTKGNIEGAVNSFSDILMKPLEIKGGER